MSTEANKTAMRQIFEEGFGKGNVGVADDLIDPAAMYGGPSAFPGPDGPEGTKQSIAYYRAAFPDLSVTVEEQMAEGDEVITRWTAVGTHTGALGKLPPTGKKATVSGIEITKFANGKVVSGWSLFDAYGMMVQLGVIPAPGG
jgi:hypothetical protein